MASFMLEGATLGQKHRSFNNIVANIQQKVVAEIDYDDNDIDNLLKIDLACKNRNINYVLKVFQSEDMLYVSRAIKRSTWLITDPQYAHIVNPKYLYNNVCPNMTIKGFNKLILHVRLNLKDEARAEGFFNYYKERDFNVAAKWLNLCSIKLIEQVLKIYADDIPKHMIKRICEKSIKCYEIYLRFRKPCYTCEDQNWTIRYLKSHTEKFLKLLESYGIYSVKIMGPEKTKLVLSRCPEIIMANVNRFAQFLHAKTFANFIKQTDMKQFIVRYIRDMRHWIKYYELDYFINRLPKKQRFKFVKDIFIDRKNKNIHEDTIAYWCNNERGYEPTSHNVYFWYKYAPFNTAFVDLKKLIRSESNPTERIAIVRVLLTCARKNMNNIQTVLKYYRENHINEAFKFKIQVINVILSQTNTHKYDEITWGYLNDLFNSMEVRSESNNNVPNCVRAIVLYNIIHNESVPDIIEQKFAHDSFKSLKNKLTEKDKEKVFLYVYNYLITKVQNLSVCNENQITEMLELVKKILNLLDDWNRDLKDYPEILNIIREIIRSKEVNKMNIDIKAIKDIKKSWRKLLFSESFLVNPTQETCINALMHGPSLLETYNDVVDIIILNEKKPKSFFFQKVRIYWPESLANTYIKLLINKLDQKNLHKACVIGLCNLLPKKDLLNILQEYSPIKPQFDKSQPDALKLNIFKQISKTLFIVRPQLLLKDILLYAKGNYAHYLNPSLNSIIYNIGSAKIREHFLNLLKGSICLKKHGLRIAFTVLHYNELTKVISDSWKTATKKRIRGYIIIKTLNYFCQQTNETVIKQMWELLSSLIEDLTSMENTLVYKKLSQFKNVPMIVRPEYWVKIYSFLRALPITCCNHHLAYMRDEMSDIIYLLNTEIVAEIFLESFDEKFSTSWYDYADLVSSFLLSTKTKEMHMERINKVLVPILERSFAMWDKIHEQSYYVQLNVERLFRKIDQKFETIILNKNMYMPLPLYKETLLKLCKKLPKIENYVLITSRKLALEYLKIFDRILNRNRKFDNKANLGIYYESAPEIGKICSHCLKEDMNNYFPSLYILFAEALDATFDSFSFDKTNQARILQSCYEFEEDPEFHLLVLKLFPILGYEEELLEVKAQILRDIGTHTSQEVKMHYWHVKGNIKRADII